MKSHCIQTINLYLLTTYDTNIFTELTIRNIEKRWDSASKNTTVSNYRISNNFINIKFHFFKI